MGGGGAVTVSGDALHANGAYAGPPPSTDPGARSSTSPPSPQRPSSTVGFANDLNAAPWATFSTTAGGGNPVHSHRPRPAGRPAGNEPRWGLLGSSHVYRIEWDTTEVRFYVDGGLVATHAVTFGATQMRPIASELQRRRPRGLRGLDADEPLHDLGHLRLPDPRRRRPGSTGAPSPGPPTPPGTGSRSASAPATPPPPTEPGPASRRSDQWRRHPRQLALRPVPRRADHQ